MKKLPYLIGMTIGITLRSIILWDFDNAINNIYWLSIGLYIPEIVNWIKRKFL